MAKKNFVGFLKRTGKGIGTGLKKTGRFIEHEKKAFSDWKTQRQKAQVKRHVQHLKEAKKHFKEEFDELGRQRALWQVKNELEQQRLEHERAKQQMKTERLQMGLQRDIVRKQISETRPKPVRKAFGIAREVFLPTREELAREKSASPKRGNGAFRETFFPKPIKSTREIIEELDRKSGLKR